MRLGLSGAVTAFFIRSRLTPLFLLAAAILGAVALWQMPREEEPQISVPMVDIFVSADGLRAVDAVELVTEPLEDIVKGIDAVEHVYSQTRDDRVVVTARFKVGTNKDDAILRVHEKVRGNIDRIPIGIKEPLIVSRGVDDVAIVVVTLYPEPNLAERIDDNQLYKIAEELRHELVKIDNVGLTYIVGGRPDRIRVEPDPERLLLYGISLNRLVEKIVGANRAIRIDGLRKEGKWREVVAGETLSDPAAIGQLLIATTDGRPVYVRDVARVVYDARRDEQRAWTLLPKGKNSLSRAPSVSLAISKRHGSNAVVIANQVLKRLEGSRGRLIPDGIRVEISRNYGETARAKANELLSQLLGATITIVLVIAIFIGWREGIAVLVVVPTTVLLTFLFSWLTGYTINRVSLFALIFAIGILVDDAIVVVDNIKRHWGFRDDRTADRAAIEAVAEVGNPTIIANLTIVAALLPMLFVSGMMGPYMSPIPVNASAAAILSFVIAIVVTPWLLLKIRGSQDAVADDDGGILGRIYRWVAEPILARRRSAGIFLAIVTAATAACCLLLYFSVVTVKLLPFDDKSELQVVVDLPEGSSLEDTDRVLMGAARKLADLAELRSIQLHSGTAAPFNFNGLVRHYFLRNSPELGDLQINLLDKAKRSRSSHAIALDVRKRLSHLQTPKGTAIKVVEVPPGPPVLATLVAEVYGPSPEARRQAARKIRKVFKDIPFIVDVDDSFGTPSERLRIVIDEQQLEYHRVEESAVYNTISALFRGTRIGYSHRGAGEDPIEIVVRLSKSDRVWSERLLSTPVPGALRTNRLGLVELGDVIKVRHEKASHPIFRRDGQFLEMVTAELAGRFEAPIYAMMAVSDKLTRKEWGKVNIPVVKLHGQPRDETALTLLWNGEWEVTYVTFRDMGLAFGVAMIAIYLLLVGLFNDFRTPLIVMVPIPLTLIGILIGHWLIGAHFTATSMIGFIALAGIVMRNSILLVDFIDAGQREGLALRQALFRAGSIRFKPIFLTSITAMIGAGFILFDPIFQGLATSLVFGLLSATVLTVLTIPCIYLLAAKDE